MISKLPVASLLVIAANLVAAFGLVYQPELVTQFGFDPLNPTFQTALSSMFLHFNAVHLLGNMVFVASVGASVELAAGSIRFLVVYLAGGLVGVLAHWLLTRRMEVPPLLIGASGSVAACIGYYSVRYMHLNVPYAPGKAISVALVTGVWAALQILGAFVRFGDTTAVAYWAHLGGLAGGLLLGVLFRAPKLAQLELGHGVLRTMNERSPGAALAASDAHIAAHPEDIEGLKHRAEALARLGDRDDESRALATLLDKLPESEQADILRRLSDIERLTVLPSIRRTLLAERFKASDPPTARLLLYSVIHGPSTDAQRPEALLSLVALEMDSHPDKARENLAELQRAHPLHPALDVARTRGWIE